MAAIAEAIRRMERAGYRLEADGGKLVVTGGKPLTQTQRDWLQRHKPALLANLAALADPNVALMLELFDAEVVAVHPVCGEHSGLCQTPRKTEETRRTVDTKTVFTRGELCG